jgi:hypothetical protein
VPIAKRANAVLPDAMLDRHKANDLEFAKGCETRMAADEFDGLTHSEFIKLARHVAPPRDFAMA